jgi:predicted ATPase/transcriptional regulator with XRE-family HTH domain
MLRNPEPAGFAAVLRRQRLAAGLTQEALAERAGMSARGIQNLEGGVTRPARDSARRLAAGLGLTSEEGASFLAAAQPAPRRAAGATTGTGGLSHNLPAPLTSFIGRERAVADLRTRLGGVRLLTLTGAGGCGKTRLALEVATGLLDRCPDGVWLVELAGLADPALVPQAVAAAVGVRELPGRDLAGALLAALPGQRLLLVLDNCEHLLEACARLVDALLRSCPALRVLATSREALGVAGEVAWRVPSLAIPDPAVGTPPAALGQYEAVRLFVERAGAARPAFALTERNAPAVARICARLDGLPLALELAAARVTALSAEQLAARLDDRFHLLTGGGRAALPRQRTLRATIAWSHDLLSPPERALFARLAAFAGGWALEAAEAVGAGADLPPAEVLDALCRLVDQSLVAAEDSGDGAVRYRLPETIREYARERLEASGEAEAARGRHAAYYADLAETATAQVTRPRPGEWLDRLEAEHDNLRAALAYLVERGEVEPALRLGASLFAFWYARGHPSGARDLLAAVLALPVAEGQPAARARALQWAGRAAYHQGDSAVSRRCYEERLAMMEHLGDRAGQAECLNFLGLLARERSDFAAAQGLFERSLALQRGVGDRHEIASLLTRLGENALYQGDEGAARTLLERGLALYQELGDDLGAGWSLRGLGHVAWATGDPAEACRLFEAALARHRAAGYGNDAVARSLHDLGGLALDAGDLATARARCTESLLLAEEAGSRATILLGLGDFAALAGARGEPARALRLAGAAAALRTVVDVALTPLERATAERAEQAARQALGDAAAAAFAEGRAMPLEHAIADALGARPNIPGCFA